MAILSAASSERILNAIQQAEKNTSGEIKVHIQKTLKEDVFEAAKKRFEKLGMTETALRNGVLFFIAINDKKFSVLGDKGINELVPDDFWASTVEIMTEYFKKNDITGGIEAGIIKAGEALKQYFPYQEDDKNELSDEISIEQ